MKLTNGIFPRALQIGLEEDLPYGDITTATLGISGTGQMRFLTRESGIISGTISLRRFLQEQGVTVTFAQQPGKSMQAGDELLSGTGEVENLLAVWRISQSWLTQLCAIATATAAVVTLARTVNSSIEVVVATRKAHLGMRAEEIQAVLDGGGIYHRNSLSDTILVTQNHLHLLGGEIPKQFYSFHHKIEIEPRSREEALYYAERADVLLLDHFRPEELKELSQELKRINPRLRVGIAGGITSQNITEYAPYVDIVVLSSVLFTSPLDITCRIEYLNNSTFAPQKRL